MATPCPTHPLQFNKFFYIWLRTRPHIWPRLPYDYRWIWQGVCKEYAGNSPVVGNLVSVVCPLSSVSSSSRISIIIMTKMRWLWNKNIAISASIRCEFPRFSPLSNLRTVDAASAWRCVSRFILLLLFYLFLLWFCFLCFTMLSLGAFCSHTHTRISLFMCAFLFLTGI